VNERSGRIARRVETQFWEYVCAWHHTNVPLDALIRDVRWNQVSPPPALYLPTWLCNALSSSSCFFLVLFSGRKRKKLTNMKKTRRISSPQALMTVFSKNLGQFPTKPINFPIPSLKHSRLGLSFLTKSWPRLHPQ